MATMSLGNTLTKRDTVDPKTVRYFFDYDGDTGRLIRIRNKTAGAIGSKIGYESKSPNSSKPYRRVSFFGRQFQTAWLVWAWHHGVLPDSNLIHKNGDTLDDRIENLELQKNLRRPVSVAHDLPGEEQPETMIGDLPEYLNTGIYEIRNVKNGRRYIGSAVNVSKRWREHLRQLEEGKHHSRFMQRCWAKNGGENFIFRVILACRQEDLIMYEQRAIDVINPQYNSNPMAASMLGHKHSPESRNKMSASRAKDFSPMTGKRHTEETCRKISEAKRGKKQSPDAVRRRADSIRKLKGKHSAKKFTEEQIKEIRRRSEAGEKNIALAREFGVSDSVICEIKNRNAYRWVE